jgi:membrane protein YdbS with pleckstrin-like domain
VGQEGQNDDPLSTQDPFPGPPPAAREVGFVVEEDEALPVPSGRQSLDPASVKAARIASWISTALVAVTAAMGMVVLAFAVELSAIGLIAAAFGAGVFLAFLGWMSHTWPVRTYRRTTWRVDEEGIEVRRGVLWRHVISVPRERIQHTDVSQGPLERRFGLATLSVHTAGNHEYEIQLSGLSRPLALGVRDSLLETPATGVAGEDDPS